MSHNNKELSNHEISNDYLLYSMITSHKDNNGNRKHRKHKHEHSQSQYLALKHNLIYNPNQTLPFLKLITYFIIGQLISLASMNNLYISTSSCSYDYSLIMALISLTIQYLFMTMIMLLIQGHLPKPKLVYIGLSLIYSINNSIEHLGYLDNDYDHSYISKLFGFIILIIYYLIKQKWSRYNKYKQRHRKMVIGIIIAVLSFTITLVIIGFNSLDSRIEDYSFSKVVFDMILIRNNLLRIVNGFSYALMTYLHEKHLNSNGEIFNSLLWISLCSSLFSMTTFIFVIHGKYDYEYLKHFLEKLEVTDGIKEMSKIVLNILCMSISGWFIIKGSGIVFLLCMIMQVYWRVIVGYYDWIGMISLVEIAMMIVGFIGCNAGLGIYIGSYAMIKAEENDEIDNENKGIELLNKRKIESKRKDSYFYNNNIDIKDDMTSECSVFSLS